ncbi:glycogen synthase GlgA [Edaphobacter modestus]|uniref:Glycogen synthase n=1 Tax=Edaphobacter modestus TaxID=388466 RepID=A0A4Q7YSK6_9BACT|nr:glycogen synthase GlgA [Edaphobacter modestus]RZU39855.1 glycogen synthase (ADP-glucose) [Edaphobacter modestus]
MHIVFAASECAPWAKTGGLADVISALPKTLVKMGHKVQVYLPYYRQVAKAVPQAPVILESVTIPFPSYNRFVRILDGGVVDGVQMYFVDAPELFDRESFYATPSGDYPDNAERFGTFCRAVIEASKVIGVPDVFHVHDWQTAMIAVMLRSIYYFDPVFQHVPAVLTIHNAGYQGWFPPRTMETLLLPWEMFTMDKLEHNDQVNFLKGGVVYADAITTVSETYAKEIQTPEFGNGLEDTLRRRSGDLFGILNGADYGEWDPAIDPYIAAHYTADKLEGKRECRRDLMHAFRLEDIDDETAVIGIVSRFATQKGIDFIVDILDRLLQEDVVLMMLGNGEEYYERLLIEMAERYPAKMRVQVKFDNVIAHKIEAGSDLFLMPSRYEPGGLSQIYSLKYGTIPVVRATGGLQDSIDEQQDGTGNGFKFSGYDSNALLDAVQRALATFRDKKTWTAMMKRAMVQDFSWQKPAHEYVRVFERVIQNRT